MLYPLFLSRTENTASHSIAFLLCPRVNPFAITLTEIEDLLKPRRMHNREASSSSSGSVKQRLHFGEVIPILHCNCGNELTLQTSWNYENPGRRFWNFVGINGMHSCGFFAWFDPPMCLWSKKIIPGLLKRVNRNEEEPAMVQKKL
nr:uncharacterized protein LOC109192855 [Ipomoea batatas]